MVSVMTASPDLKPKMKLLSLALSGTTPAYERDMYDRVVQRLSPTDQALHTFMGKNKFSSRRAYKQARDCSSLQYYCCAFS